MFSSLAMKPAWLLGDLYVAPAGRRTGAGRALLREVLRRAREAGVSGVQLETAYDNLVAQGLYEAEGFVREEFHVYFHDLSESASEKGSETGSEKGSGTGSETGSASV